MTLAIKTQYMGATNTRGSRVKAVARGAESWGDSNYPPMQMTQAWDNAAKSDENHCRIAKACAEKYNWGGVYVAGGLSGGGYVFVNISGFARDVAAFVALLEQSGKIPDRDFFVTEEIVK